MPSPPRMKPVFATFATEAKMLTDPPEMVPALVTLAMPARTAIEPPVMLPRLVTVSVAPSCMPDMVVPAGLTHV